MNRRHFLIHSGAFMAAGLLVRPALAQGLPASDFGIFADIEIDQSAAFASFLAQAARRGLPAFIPGGRYRVSGLEIPDGSILQGIAGRTVLAATGAGPVLQAREKVGIRISGLRVDGATMPGIGEAGGVIDLRGVSQVSIRDCDIRNGGTDGIYLESCGGEIEHTSISRVARHGLFSVQSTGLRIAFNDLADCGNGGIIVHRWEPGGEDSLIIGNRVSRINALNGGTGQWGNGINLFRTDNVTVSDNHISDCAFSAFRANATRSITVSGNICKGSGETAIYAEFGFTGAVISNNLVDGGSNGISVTNFEVGGRGATVTGNIVRNIDAIAPYEVPGGLAFGTGISVEADTTVTGNLVERIAGIGINAGWGRYLRDCVISANVIRDAAVGIGVSAVEGAGTTIIADNTISARDGAIRAHRWNDIAATDLAAEPALAPAHVTIEGNRTS